MGVQSRHGRRASAVLIIATAMSLLAACSASEEGGGGETIKIAALYDVTGALAVYGEPATMVTQMIVDEINDEGGIQGRTVELVTRDTASDPTAGVTEARRVIGDDVDLILGGSYTPVALAINEVANRQKALFFSPLAASPALTNPVQPLTFAASQTAQVSANGIVTLASSMGARTIGFIGESGAYGEQALAAIQTAVNGTDLTIVSTQEIASDAGDATTQIAKIQVENPDVIVVGVTAPAVAIIRAVDRAALATPVIAFGGGSSAAVDDLLAGDAPIEYYAVSPLACPMDGECARAFVERYEKVFGTAPAQWAAQTYAATSMFFEALRQAESFDPEAVAQALEEMEPFKSELIPVPLEFSPDDHLAVDETYLYGFKDGVLSFFGNDISNNTLAGASG